ncbi:MAG: 2-C-methyl-D-erythritol 4-phosphate cytidylyltransferase [Lachnospiraceae bacterium]|nr:2-C-methyl-D-erythritol 4-phosphate cytidylyltransferase [Lachnospiraceae bacterium]
MRNVAIVLAAGSGSRMNLNVKKQYMLLNDKPLLAYSMDVFEKSDIITDVILVTSKEDIEYCRNEIVSAFGYSKVRAVIAGGKERYHSVMAGLDRIREDGDAEYVFIHDAARPFVTEDMIKRLYEDVISTYASVAAVKSKDTVKIANNADYVVSTPNRELTWIIQTPQTFRYSLALEAYDRLREEEDGLGCQGIKVTDDAMVVETWTDHKVRLIEGSYENIKVTTPEDIDIAEAIIKRRIN